MPYFCLNDATSPRPKPEVLSSPWAYASLVIAFQAVSLSFMASLTAGSVLTAVSTSSILVPFTTNEMVFSKDPARPLKDLIPPAVPPFMQLGRA